jgi:hypothetical protein
MVFPMVFLMVSCTSPAAGSDSELQWDSPEVAKSRQKKNVRMHYDLVRWAYQSTSNIYTVYIHIHGFYMYICMYVCVYIV